MPENYLVEGKCPENCGRCCTSILALNEHEINKIKKYIRRNNIKPINRNSNPSSEYYIDVCPFLNEENRCNIYIHRPEICQYFTCGENNKQFKHIDKTIVNLNEVFFPEEIVYNKPDLTNFNNRYRLKKEQIYGEANPSIH